MSSQDFEARDVVILLPEVERQTGLKRTAIYERTKAGTFPRSVPRGTRHVGWLQSEVQEWVENLRHDATAAAHEDGLGIGSRIHRSESRGVRSQNANARLTTEELQQLKDAARAERKSLGEWNRDVLLAAARGAQTDRALFTELTALRLLMTNVLRPLALGKTLSPEEFQAIQAGVRNDKHDAAQQLLAQYQPKRTEEQ